MADSKPLSETVELPSYSGKALDELTEAELMQAFEDVRKESPHTHTEAALLAMVHATLAVEIGRRKGLIK